MELWIRNQDKTILSKPQNIVIRENQNENNETNYAIVDIYTMGIYSTKKRALEVLDEIQRLITDLQYMSYAVDSSSFYSYRPNVYEMPKE